MAKKKLVRKTHVVPFVNVGTDSAPDWRRIEKSKTFTLSTNPQVKTYDYISSDIPEEEITGYQPSLAQSITMWKNSDDYEEFFGMLFKLPTGENAHRDVMVAFYQEKGKSGSDDVYKAWKVDALVKISQMDTVDESINFDLSFNKIVIGALSFASGKAEFIKGEWTGDTFTPAT